MQQNDVIKINASLMNIIQSVTMLCHQIGEIEKKVDELERLLSEKDTCD